MIAAVDVHYFEDECAFAAAVLFRSYFDAQAAAEYTSVVRGVSRYVPGQFYTRELPCILRVLEQLDETPDEIVIDGYVTLGNWPGLGQHLFDHFGGRVAVIGVAKSKYKNASGVEVLRGGSTRPLYVTAAGIVPHAAADRIRTMHGNHRIPTLLRRADLLARKGLGRP